MTKPAALTGAFLIALEAFGAGLLGGGSPASAQPLLNDPGPSLLTVQRGWRSARPNRRAVAGVPVVIPLDGSGVAFQTPFTDVLAPDGSVVTVRLPHYQGPDGTYDDLADLTNAIQGTPCGQECTARSLVRWGLAPVQ